MYKQFYSVREACEYLAIGRTRIYELFKQGDLRLVKLGHKSLVPKQSLEDYAAKICDQI